LFGAARGAFALTAGNGDEETENVFEIVVSDYEKSDCLLA
jgi:hypothetical protein